MMKDERELAIEYIRKLNERELTEFFYQAVSDRREIREFDDGFEIDTFCIARSAFGEFRHKEDQEHLSEFLALPAGDLADLDWIQKIKGNHEQGCCDRCNADVACAAKEAVCPICESIVECT